MITSNLKDNNFNYSESQMVTIKIVFPNAINQFEVFVAINQSTQKTYLGPVSIVVQSGFIRTYIYIQL